ncbi:cadherin EGF LAG seven-pass G-type receptor 2 isoform X3 [Hydra vulgaris]
MQRQGCSFEITTLILKFYSINNPTQYMRFRPYTHACSHIVFNEMIVLWLIVGLFVHAATNHVPQFSNEISVIEVNEEEPIGTYVTKVTATDSDNDEVFYSTAEDEGGYFVIDKESGIIRTAKKIDRESLKSDTIKFKVVAAEIKRPDQNSALQVIIHVLDINDNPPVFEKNLKEINLSESTPIDTFVTVIRASDVDKKSELLYSFVSGNEDEVFSIDHYTGQIRTIKNLDYETKSKYLLRIAVADGRSKDPLRHIETTNLEIKILDEDDNGAVFYTNYTATIKEGQHQGEVIVRVHAEDLDRGINSPVRYSIDPSSNYGNIFSVDSQGDVRVQGLVDRETIPIYKLKILATETLSSFGKHVPGYTLLTVVVTDVNDNRPKFENLHYVIKVKENEHYGVVVKSVKAYDIDEGENAKFEYHLQGADEVFGITQFGEIFVKGELDREKKDIYNFKVLAQQASFQPDAYADVTAIVEDINDHAPVFVNALYTASIRENEASGVFLAHLSAHDLDKDDNAKITYSIFPDAENTSACFQIGLTDGRLTTKCSLDYEEKTSHSFLIQASDNPKSGEKKFSTTKVKINVLDENDNIPIFKQLHLYKNIRYDEEINAPVVKVEATDKDTGSYGDISYRVLSGNDLQRFHIDQKTGQIKLIDSLAAYTNNKFQLVVEAYDNNGNPPSNNCQNKMTVSMTVDKRGLSSVALYMNSPIQTVTKNEETILSQLRSILEMGIATDLIEKGAHPESTVFTFHGFNVDTFALTKKEKIISILDSSKSDLIFRFRHDWNITGWNLNGIPIVGSYTSTSKKKESDKVNPIVYAVLGFVGMIVIFGVIFTLVLIKTKRRNENNTPHTTLHDLSSSSKMRMWDNGFESVSQVGEPQSYIQMTGFLNRSTEKYDYDPSNMYNENCHVVDPFDAIRDRLSSRGSTASSIFGASSVMTVCKVPKSRLMRSSSDIGSTTPLSKKKMSCILEQERRRANTLSLDRRVNRQPLVICRPPSYDYDFDEEVHDENESPFHMKQFEN